MSTCSNDSLNIKHFEVCFFSYLPHFFSGYFMSALPIERISNLTKESLPKKLIHPYIYMYIFLNKQTECKVFLFELNNNLLLFRRDSNNQT